MHEETGYTAANVRIRILLLVMAAAASLSAQAPATTSPTDPTPSTIEEFQATAARILHESQIPGAGMALVRSDGVEWEGGIGLADRDRKTPVTADTHFRVGSISKTFVAMSLVQLAEDGLLDLDAVVVDLAPDVAIDNPFHGTDPVRVIHVLQHTAGFDDMHFNERYASEPDLPLLEVLTINPASRRVRWPPGTRMAYSNPGYAVAGYLIEVIAGRPYHEYIRDEIFLPLGMTTSSFVLTPDDHAVLASGYAGAEGAPVGYPAIHLRPAGNMHSSAREMGLFVRMLLNWGELGTAFVIDPEYLGSMEYPRTTLASRHGLRNGYGSGIATRLTLPYRVLGHNGHIDGFASTYGYSTSRDVGYVILLNSSSPGANRAIDRLASLAIRYLKRDVEPPTKPEVEVEAATLDRYVGYYHDANPRNQLLWGVQWLLAGRTIVRDGTMLYSQPVFGERVRLVPVSDTLFRLDNELDASRVFAEDDAGTLVLAGTDVYAERQTRWRVEVVRLALALAIALNVSVFLVAVVWVARIRRALPRGFWLLKIVLLLCPIALIAPAMALSLTPRGEWGEANAGTISAYLGTLSLPALAAIVVVLSIVAYRQGASRWLVSYAWSIAAALAAVSWYLASSDLMGIRLWTY